MQVGCSWVELAGMFDVRAIRWSLLQPAPGSLDPSVPALWQAGHRSSYRLHPGLCDRKRNKEGKVYPQVAWQTTLARASPTTHAQLPPPPSLDQHLQLSTEVWPPSSSSKRTSPAKQRPPRPTSCARTSSSKQPSRTRQRALRSVTIPSLLSLASLAPCDPVLADPILVSLGMTFAGLERPGVRLRRRLEHRSKRPLRRSPRRLTKSVPFLPHFLLSSPQSKRRMLTLHI